MNQLDSFTQKDLERLKKAQELFPPLFKAVVDAITPSLQKIVEVIKVLPPEIWEELKQSRKDQEIKAKEER